MESQPPNELFESNLPLIREILEKVCRLRRLTLEEKDDFSSYVWLRLIQRDYAVVREFRGKSSFQTYLVTAISRMLLDYRDRQWGKWRPSAAALRLGETAVLLETLMNRDGLTPDEAIEKLAKGRSERHRAELASVAALLPRRLRKRIESVESLEHLPSREQADDLTLARERRSRVRKVRTALRETLAELTSEERLIVDMHFRKGITVRQIASVLGVEPQRLYRRIERCLRRIRTSVESRNVSRETVREMLGLG